MNERVCKSGKAETRNLRLIALSRMEVQIFPLSTNVVVAQLAEYRPSKAGVARSLLVYRSSKNLHMAEGKAHPQNEGDFRFESCLG